MKFLQSLLSFRGLSELDRQIDKFRALRDSYQEANVAHYGKKIADMLKD